MGRPALLIALKDEFIKRKPRLIAGSIKPLEPLDDRPKNSLFESLG
jgi:hypothetical protein